MDDRADHLPSGCPVVGGMPARLITEPRVIWRTAGGALGGTTSRSVEVLREVNASSLPSS